MSDLNIRSIDKNDLQALIKIHKEFYASEFDFPDFVSNYLCVFVIEDQNGIISAGGVRQIAESVIITDKNRSVRTRVEALNKMLQANEFVCRKFGHNQLHAFIQDSGWKEQLIKSGFVPCKGDALVISFGDK